MTEPKRPVGRPRKHKPEKRTSHTFRVGERIRRLLNDASLENGRSLSEEIEARIAASFDQPALIDALAEQLEARRRTIVKVNRVLMKVQFERYKREIDVQYPDDDPEKPDWTHPEMAALCESFKT